MGLGYLIIAAFCLDLLVGDPQWLIHPARMIGLLALRIENPAKKILRYDFIAGAVTAIIVLGIAGLSAFLLLKAATLLHPLAGVVVSVLLIYTTIACRDLAKHSSDVYRQLAKKDISSARTKVALIVGRDTDGLDEPEVARAAVESVAESTVDGITAPLFYAAIAGPIGAIVYRAINTLDSTFGYKNQRYKKFGWACAKIDDLANYIPARLTAVIMALSAGILRLRVANAFKILFRDCKNHTSPNSGFPEAAMAGALGIQLGGLNSYFGKPAQKPFIGEPLQSLSKGHIKKANMLMITTSIAFLAVSVILRCLIIKSWQGWSTAI